MQTHTQPNDEQLIIYIKLYRITVEGLFLTISINTITADIVALSVNTLYWELDCYYNAI